MKLSLIVTYSGRKSHLQTQLAWWRTQPSRTLCNCEIIIVEADEHPSVWIASELNGTNIKYAHLPCIGVFHKTKALNLGLSISQGQFVAPFDVDLIPLGDTLGQHLQIAEISPHFLVTGYRVMCSSETIDFDDIPIEEASIAPEDLPTALWKQLICKERFGVVPLFNRTRLMEIGGWDEEFVGWGGEDQDIIERYLQDGRYLCRCPELVYLHLAHERHSHWAEASLVEQK